MHPIPTGFRSESRFDSIAHNMVPFAYAYTSAGVIVLMGHYNDNQWTTMCFAGKHKCNEVCTKTFSSKQRAKRYAIAHYLELPKEAEHQWPMSRLLAALEQDQALLAMGMTEHEFRNLKTVVEAVAVQCNSTGNY